MTPKTYRTDGMKNCLALFLCGLLHLAAVSQGIAAEEALFRHIGERDGLLVIDSTGRVVFSKHADRLLVPASTLKLVTSLAALETLGPEFRFKTEVFLTEAGDMILKGYADPLLISEVMTDMAVQTAKALAPRKSFRRLVVDDAFVDPNLSIPGRSDTDNPYDAPNGALCANFNTVAFASDGPGRFRSDEPQTPLVAFSLERIQKSGLSRGRIVFSHRMHEASLYAGHLFRRFLDDWGISFSEGVVHGQADPDRHRRVLSYLSPYPLTSVIEKLLNHSNNFIANQMLLVMGASPGDGPATLEKGVTVVRRYLDRHIGPGRVKIAEGSGLSRENRICAEDLCRCLALMTPYRMLLRAEGREFYKTGTLDGVRARAGYIRSRNGEFYRFALLLNTPGKTAEPIMQALLARLP